MPLQRIEIAIGNARQRLRNTARSLDNQSGQPRIGRQEQKKTRIGPAHAHFRVSMQTMLFPIRTPDPGRRGPEKGSLSRVRQQPVGEAILGFRRQRHGFPRRLLTLRHMQFTKLRVL